MSIIRTDEQADSVEILKLVIETSDYYREMADVVEDESLANKLEEIGSNRADYIEPLENVVKALDELPAQPDPEKELAQKIGGEITRLVSADAKNAILDKCLDEDDKLADLISQTSLGEKSPEFSKLLGALSDNLSHTRTSIQALKD